MAERRPVVKTCKLFIGGAYPRSESGRVLPVHRAAPATSRRSRSRTSKNGRAADAEATPPPIAYVAHASRKDLRDAVERAGAAHPGWAARDAYNRGQVIYRLAELVEGRRDEFASAIRDVSGDGIADARREVDASIERLVSFAGWADKYGHVLGTHNPVNGPYWNFTVPEATGVAAVVAPDEPAMLGLVTLLAAGLAVGCALVVVPSTANPLPAVLLSEACPASDVPAGVVNVLTGRADDLVPHLASHRAIDAIVAADLDDEAATTLRAGAAENLKRVHIADVGVDGWFDHAARTGPWAMDPFTECKTIWHPAAP